MNDMYFRFSLYPMADEYVSIILDHLEQLEPFDIQIETDDVSTLMTGHIDAVFGALEAFIASVARRDIHFAVSGMFMINCPTSTVTPKTKSKVVLPPSRQYVSSQFYLFPLGADNYVDTILDEVQHAHAAGLVKGDTERTSGIHGPLTEVLHYYKSVLLRAKTHTFMQMTMSVNSPSHRKKK